ncbi:hypothetical protein ACFLZK_02220, partial [Patescibacteria group bacterium]
MKLKRLLKASVFLLIAVIIFFSNSVKAQIAECDSEQKFVGGTRCPCPEDESLASICGIVKSADINSINVGDIEQGAFITRNPMKGVTVSVYENVGGVPSGQPFGNLENKLVECVTSEREGKYFCPVRRLNPGNTAYIVFSCNGKVSDIKIIPTTRSIVGLNSDVSCTGELEYTPLPTVLSYAERDNFLGCKSEIDKPNENIKYEEKEFVYQSTQIGEEDGDIRFTPNSGFTPLNIYYHPGAMWSKDCVTWYGRPENDIDREFNIAGGYSNVFQKCNYKEEGGAGMDAWDLSTTPFRYDIPDSDIMPTNRVWETRSSMQREMQDPRAYQQFNHLMFGDCLGNAFLRYYGQDAEDTPISCSALSKCTSIGDPKRNIHTTHSFGSRLTSPITWEDILEETLERDSSDVVCRDTEGDYGPAGENITIAEIQPPGGGENCVPGESGCIYKLTSDFYLPQFFIMAEGVKKPKTSETFGDSYGPQGVRREEWLANESESKQPHQSGHYVNFECSGTGKNNCGTTSLRISSDDEFFDETITEGKKGALTDRFRNFVDVEGDYYDDTYTATIYDVGGDVRSLCTISSVQDLFVINDATETDTFVSNFFSGNKESHSEDNVAGTATYATEGAIQRDFDLAERATLDAIARDYFDSLQRFSSGGGILERSWSTVATLYQSIFGRDPRTVKSFGHRVDEGDWNKDTPATVNTKFCISEESFVSKFPVYIYGVPNGFPGSAPGCYPWNNISKNDYCDVYPGRGVSPSNMLRTCKVERCVKEYIFETACVEQGECTYGEVDPITGRFECLAYDCLRTEETSTAIPCDEGDIRLCLRRQKDTWEGSATRGGDKPYCDLWRAGPMVDPGDIGGDRGFSHGAQIVQQEVDGTADHYNVDSVSASGNDTVSRWLSPVGAKYNMEKASFVDYASTNDLKGIRGGGAGATHQTTAGTRAKGEGFGGTASILDVVTNPLSSSGVIEDYTACDESTGDLHCWECNPLTSTNSWCKKIPPPGEVDLDTIDGGSCKPKITGSCPLVGEGIGDLALDILGAAGEHAGGVS